MTILLCVAAFVH